MINHFPSPTHSISTIGYTEIKTKQETYFSGITEQHNTLPSDIKITSTVTKKTSNIPNKSGRRKKSAPMRAYHYPKQISHTENKNNTSHPFEDTFHTKVGLDNRKKNDNDAIETIPIMSSPISSASISSSDTSATSSQQESTQTDHNKTKKSKNNFPCHICKNSYTSKGNRVAHIKSKHTSITYKCRICKRIFSFPQTLKLHMITHSDPNKLKCTVCGNTYTCIENLKKHRLIHTQ